MIPRKRMWVRRFILSTISELHCERGSSSSLTGLQIMLQCTNWISMNSNCALTTIVCAMYPCPIYVPYRKLCFPYALTPPTNSETDKPFHVLFCVPPPIARWESQKNRSIFQLYEDGSITAKDGGKGTACKSLASILLLYQIQASLAPTRLSIYNDSHKHSHHDAMVNAEPTDFPNETHFRVEIISEAFAGKVIRHAAPSSVQ